MNIGGTCVSQLAVARTTWMSNVGHIAPILATCAESRFTDRFRCNTFFKGDSLRDAVSQGGADYTPSSPNYPSFFATGGPRSMLRSYRIPYSSSSRTVGTSEFTPGCCQTEWLHRGKVVTSFALGTRRHEIGAADLHARASANAPRR